jgi:hypothetical protein
LLLFWVSKSGFHRLQLLHAGIKLLLFCCFTLRNYHILWLFQYFVM